MYCIQAVASGVLKAYVQEAWSPNPYHICRPVYALGLDACLYRGKVN